MPSPEDPTAPPAGTPFWALPPRSVVVDVGGLAAASDPAVTLVTYALGSCVGVALHDPHARVAGLLHVQLPDSALDPARALRQPGLFADTGVPALLARMFALGAHPRRLTARIAGAAQLLGDRTLFDVGNKNLAATLAVLLSYGLTPTARHTGGTAPRTLYLTTATGNLRIRTSPSASAA